MNGGISFGGGNVNTGGWQCWNDARFYDTLRVAENAIFDKSVTVSTELTIAATPVLQTLVAHAISIGTNAGQAATNATDIAALQPVLRTDETNNPGVALTDETHVLAGNPLWTSGQNQSITVDYTLPANPDDARRIEFFGNHYGNNGATPSAIYLVIGSNDDHITAGSVGTLGGYQGSNGYFGNTRLVCRFGHYVAIFKKSVRAWTIVGTPTAGPP